MAEDARREVDFTLVAATGLQFKVTLVDHLSIERVANNMFKAEGFRRRTGRNIDQDMPNREIRDYLIKLGVVFP